MRRPAAETARNSASGTCRARAWRSSSQPLLLAWTLQGKGQTEAALTLLRPLSESGRLRTLYAMHAALIADLADRRLSASRASPSATTSR